MSETLDVEYAPVEDNSIKKVYSYTFSPRNPAALGNNDVLHYELNRADSFVLLHRSYFSLSGKITVTTTNTAGVRTTTAPTRSKLVNVLHLFNRAELKINGVTVEQVSEPGLTCLAKIATTYNEWEMRHLDVMGMGGVSLDGDGRFHNVLIPARVLFGLAEDLRHVLVNPRLEIDLTRSRTDDNAVHSTAAEEYNLQLDSVDLELFFVRPDDANYLRLLKIVEKNKPLLVAFRAFTLYQYPELPQTEKHSWAIRTTTQLEKPRYALFLMQNSRDGDSLKNSNLFDHNDLREFVLWLNNEGYPEHSVAQSFEKNNYSLFYHQYAMLGAAFKGIPDATPLLKMDEYKSKMPIIAIDCSHQEENLRNGAIDVKAIFSSNARFKQGVRASIILVHDSVFDYNPFSGVTRKHEG